MVAMWAAVVRGTLRPCRAPPHRPKDVRRGRIVADYDLSHTLLVHDRRPPAFYAATDIWIW